jgi:trehalose 6-phosphate phosphatase
MDAEISVPISPRLSACTNLLLGSPERCALFLDVDGTLLDLAVTPDRVVVPDGLTSVLQRLQRTLGGAVAVNTGRMISTIDGLLHPLRLAASGVHGAELRFSPDLPIERVEAKLPEALLVSLYALAAQFPGVIVETKGAGLSIHYRLVPDAEQPILTALHRSLDLDIGLFKILSGKKLFEVLPCGHSKATGLAALSRQDAFRNRIPIMIGDDVGDEVAFSAVEAMNGVALRVAGEHFGAELADFAGPRAVVRWLDQLAHRFAVLERSAARA